VVEAAYSDDVLEGGSNSSVIELDPSTAVVVHVKEHLKPEQLKLEEVADSIREHLTTVRASEAAKAAGERQSAELSAGDTAADQAQWAVTEAATRAQEGVDPVVLQALFRMPKPADDGKPTYTGVSLASGDF